MQLRTLIGDALLAPPAAICHRVTDALRAGFAGLHVLETDAHRFDLVEFARAGLCSFTEHPHVPAIALSQWDADDAKVDRLDEHGVYEVRRGATVFTLVVVSWDPENGSRRQWLIGPSRAETEAFFAEVCAWNSEVRGEILVFEGGKWAKSEELFRAIKTATFDNLVLPASLLAQLREDAAGFFDARALYERYGVPWKRGLLLTGPPGNGKTHTVKALCNTLGRPVLYVKGLRARHTTDHDAIEAVFTRARQAAPCVLVLEDLDAMIDDGNRSFFLNELDGFAGNTGLLVVATTNHPERLDPAIVQRPSRFDRRYAFNLPARAERLRYLERWNGAAEREVRLSDRGLAHAADASDGFSFAYLKELMMSAVMAWVRANEAGAMDAVVAQQVGVLREQIKLPRAVEIAVGLAPNVGFIPPPAPATATARE